MSNNTEKNKEIREVTGVAKWAHIRCPNCPKIKVASYYELIDAFPWAVKLSCNEPNHPDWYVCKECSHLRKPIFTENAIYKHNFNYHNGKRLGQRPKKRQKVLPENLIYNSCQLENNIIPKNVNMHNIELDIKNFDESDSYDQNVSSDIDSSKETEAIINPVNITTTKTVVTSTAKVPIKDETSFTASEAASLVAKSQFQLQNVGSLIPEDEVDTQIAIACLVKGISQPMRLLLSEVLLKTERMIKKQAMRQYLRDKNETNEKSWSTYLPNNPNLMRTMLLEGKHALLPNLPIPKIEVIDDHAYISPIEIIKHVLENGIKIDRNYTKDYNKTSIANVCKVTESTRFEEIMSNAVACSRENVLCIWMTEWSDDFVPYHASKSNRGSIWMKTLTICPPSSNNKCSTNTYPVAVGPKSSSHECIETQYLKDLLSLSNGNNSEFFDYESGKLITVHAELIASLQDQPERRNMNYLMHGNSTYHARFGYSCNFKELYSKIIACDSCFEKLLHSEQDSSWIQNTVCKICSCWNIINDNDFLSHDPSKTYPKDILPPSKKIYPKKITYKGLIEAISIAHNKFTEGKWNIGNVEEFLSVNCICTSLSKNVIQNAKNEKAYNNLYNAGSEHSDAFSILHEQKTANPKSFSQVKYPSIWSKNNMLSSHIDVPMHLLFLGIVCTVEETIQKWIKGRQSMSNFLKVSLGQLEEIEQLQLSWCKVLPYTGEGLGSWISENYVGFAKVAPWFYSSLEQLAPDPVYVEPKEPAKKWKKDQYKEWLKVRNKLPEKMKNKNTNISSLRELVLSYIQRKEGPPPIPAPIRGPVSDILQLVAAMKKMISAIMVSTVTETNILKARCLIKIFLSSFHKVDKQLNNSDSKPKWVSAYNFVCLLNIPDIMRHFGPIPNLWEGDYRGEKYIQIIKGTHVYRGQRKNWQRNMLRHLLQMKALDNIRNNICPRTKEFHLDNLTTDEEDEETDENKVEFRKLYQYKSEAELTFSFLNGKPISAVLFSDGRYGCILKNSYVIFLEADGNEQLYHGFIYQNWKLTANTMLVDDLNTSKDFFIFDYLLLLPRFNLLSDCKRQTVAGLYTSIPSNWNLPNWNGKKPN